MPPGTKFHLNRRLLPFLSGLLIGMFLLESYRGWFVMLVGLGGAWLIGYLWVRSLAQGLKLTRKMRFGWAQVGDRLEERFELRNEGWAPGLWVELAYESNMPDYQPQRVASVGSNGAYYRWHSSGVCTRRGLFTLGPITLHSSDPFGIYSVSIPCPGTKSLLVMPPVVPLPWIEVSPGGRSGEGRPRPRAHERTSSASSVREYQPGDSLRWIHWRTTARRDQFFVRLLDTTPASDWYIFLDLDAETQAGIGYDSTEEHGVILAASLVDRGLREGHAVGLFSHGDELTWLPPRLGEEHRQDLLRSLALASPGPSSLEQLLSLARPTFRENPSLIIITANLESPWADALFPLLEREIVPTVLLLDPSSYNGRADQQRRVDVMQDILSERGISCTVITREIFDRPEARPGKAGQWLWAKAKSSKAVLDSAPGDLAWRELG